MLNRQQARVIKECLLIAKEATDEKLSDGNNIYLNDMHLIEEALEHLASHARNNAWGGFEIVNKAKAERN
jgi:hypothetical protein